MTGRHQIGSDMLHPISLLIIALGTLAFTVATVGCAPDPDQIGVHRPAEQTATKRFTAEYQGKFNAGYGSHERAILVITDTTTGRKYLAITGCGVTELFTEGSGKNAHTVEE